MQEGSIKKHGAGWRLRVDLGDQLARRCTAGCRAVVWVDDDHRADCPTCGAPLGEATMRRRQRARTYRTQTEAREARKKALGRIDAGQTPIPPKETVAQFARRWLRHLDAQGKPRPQTVRRYREVLDAYVLPLVGGQQVAKLTAGDVQACLDAMRTDRGLAPATVSKCRAAVSSMLQWGLQRGAVAVNVARATTAPEQPEQKRKAPTPADLRAAIDAAANTPWSIPVLLAASTGARRSEVLAMRWAKVDLDAATVRVDAGLHRVRTETGSELVFTPPKTKAGDRVVPLPPLAVERLRFHRAAQARRKLALGADWHDLDLVCERGDGRPMDPSSFTHGWARIAKGAGLDGVRLHDLRHGVATSLARRGARPSVTAAVLGHSNPTFTARVYEHPDEAMLAEAAAELAEALDQ